MTSNACSDVAHPVPYVAAATPPSSVKTWASRFRFRFRLRLRLRPLLLAAALPIAMGPVGAAQAASRGLPPETGARVIVGYKTDPGLVRAQALSTTALSAASATAERVHAQAQRKADTLAERAGVRLTAGRALGARSFVVRADGIDSDTLAARLASHPDLAYAVPDRRRRANAVPNDPLFAAGPSSGRGPAVGQWYLHAPDATVVSAVNAQGAWDRVTGSSSIVVAVIDTGVLSEHPDLAGVVLPGYDMIDDAATANDGDGRDADARDAGDWITAAEDGNRRGPFFNCGAEASSWHGTQVAGIIGAAANNGVGMAGTAHGVRILPVRVLGKCGGYDSDIIVGIRWAAGVVVPGLPANPTPARVLNLSLGSSGACSEAYRTAVAEVAAAPYLATVVAAAGNSAGHAVGTPANCPGVIGVAGLRHTGSKVGFSDLGPEVALAAPGGNCVNIGANDPCLYPILSSTNSGTQSPNAGGSTWTDSYDYGVGTSFSSPIVAGVAALVLSARPELAPAQLKELLTRNVRPFPTTGSDNGADDPTPVSQCRAPDGSDQLQCYCTTSTCGAGIIDAGAAVLEAVQRVPLKEAARQLMDFGERSYASLFPGTAATQVSGPFVYRFYPATGLYLGVVVQSDASYTLNGVYVLGGSFGDSPVFVGQLTDYISPLAAASSAGRSR
jgi:serine protease